MASFLIGLFTFGLILLCIILILLVLMQRASANAGMGASLGGGAAESAFGAESGNMLTRWTIYGTVAFFVITFGLYLAQMLKTENAAKEARLLPEITTIHESEGGAKETPGSLTEVPQE